jgi:hypothetical protein
MIDAKDVADHGTTLFVLAGGTFWMLRWLIRTFHIDTLANKSNHAEVNVIDRLESEITRLEKIIDRQQVDITSMAKAQANLEKLVSNQKAVLMAVELIVSTMCTCDTGSRAKVTALINELIDSTDKA